MSAVFAIVDNSANLEDGLGGRFVDAKKCAARIGALELRGGDPWRVCCDDKVTAK